jgi:hypothetical protein
MCFTRGPTIKTLEACCCFRVCILSESAGGYGWKLYRSWYDASLKNQRKAAPQKRGCCTKMNYKNTPHQKEMSLVHALPSAPESTFNHYHAASRARWNWLLYA